MNKLMTASIAGLIALLTACGSDSDYDPYASYGSGWDSTAYQECFDDAQTSDDLDPASLAALAKACGKVAAIHATSQEAVQAAIEEARSDAVVVATGSLYLTGEVRAWAGLGNPGGGNPSP